MGALFLRHFTVLKSPVDDNSSYVIPKCKQSCVNVGNLEGGKLWIVSKCHDG